MTKNKLINKNTFSKLFYLAMTLFMAFAFHIVAQPYIIGYQDGTRKPAHGTRKDSISQPLPSNQNNSNLNNKNTVHHSQARPKQSVHDSIKK
jgi:hypothetical protein